jgi:hypothetical protein
MLDEMAAVGAEGAVSWQPNGMAFRVHQPEVFTRTVMPRYFKQTQYKSFQRQLHIYGFRRIGKGIGKGGYFHSMFIRNKKPMSLQMSPRVKSKGKKKSTDAVHSSTDAVHPRAAAVDPDFCCSETHEEPLVKNELLFNQQLSGSPSPSPQLIGSNIALGDWMEEAQTVLSTDEEPARPYHGYDSSTYEKKKSNDVSAFLPFGNNQKYGDEGSFEGKRFFYVVERTKTLAMLEHSNAVVNRKGRIFKMPRSA